MLRLAHLSDLHFGRADQTVARKLIARMQDQKPDIVAVSGDVTQTAAKREFLQAAEFFGNLPGRLLIVPGNHDLPGWNIPARFLSRFSRFRRVIGSEPDPVLRHEQAVVVGLNTARLFVRHWNWANGRISRRQLARVEAALGSAAPGALRVVVMHHPIAPQAGRRWQALVGRARRAARAFAEAKVDLVLTGHLHTARHRNLSELYPLADYSTIAFQSATTLSNRLRGEPNSYRTFEANTDHVTVTLHSWDGKDFILSRKDAFRRTPSGLIEAGSAD